MTSRHIARRLAQQPDWTGELARRIGGVTEFTSAKD